MKDTNNKYAKVPSILQLEALECGAACLAMILAYYDKWVPLEQLRLDCGVSRNGSSAKKVMDAAENYNLDTEAYTCEPDDLKKEGNFPAIIHWKFNHFVVLNGFKHNKAYITDPGRGSYSVSMEEFDKSFTGVVMYFKPSKDFVSSGKQKSVMSFVVERMKGSSVAVAFVLLTAVISSFMGFFSPAFSRVFLDIILPKVDVSWIAPFFIILACFSFIQIVMLVIKALYSLKITGKIAVVGNTTYLWKVLHLPMKFFSQRMTGDILSRQSMNAQVAATLVDTVAPLLLNFILTIFYLFVMVRYNIFLSIIGILSVLFNVFLSMGISKQRNLLVRPMLIHAGKLNGTMVSGVDSIDSIKSNGAESGYFMKWSGYQADVNSDKVRYTKINQYLSVIPSIISSICDFLVLGVGVYLTMNGAFTVGMIMAFQGFMNSFIAPASSLITAGQTFIEMRTKMERIDDVMKYPDDVRFDKEQANDEDLGKLSGNIKIENLYFGYSELDEPIIKDFNMDVKAGQTVAIVGHSGSGKSTMAKLICGLFKPKSGCITFDDKKFMDIDNRIFTSSVAVVDQDITIFKDTIANNIKMWDKSIEDFEMILAARDAQIHNEIMEKEGGYNYELTAGGSNISGGQRQRLEIARVFAADPTIIVFDEATSSLDAKTENKVISAIKQRGITCIFIAHRLSTIRKCDEIIVLEKGEIVERGTHDELMKLNNKYVKLVESD